MDARTTRYPRLFLSLCCRRYLVVAPEKSACRVVLILADGTSLSPCRQEVNAQSLAERLFVG
jgi:hypothetical protein